MGGNESAEHLVRVARLAREVAEGVLPRWAHRFAPHKFTQPQLAACLVLKVWLRQDYRGICGLLALSDGLRKAMGLKQVPHYSTLARFAQDKLTGPVLGGCSPRWHGAWASAGQQTWRSTAPGWRAAPPALTSRAGLDGGDPDSSS